MANSLFNTLVPLVLRHLGYSASEIGLIASGYFLGMLCGAIKTERLVLRLGHLRSYVLFALSLSAVALLHGAILKGEVWYFLRFLAGFSMAGLFIVIESWCIAMTELEQRGYVMALYHILFYAAYSMGQLLLNIRSVDRGFFYFGLIALLMMSSTLPFIWFKPKTPNITSAPQIHLMDFIKVAPSGFLAGIVGGQSNAIFYTLLPLYVVGIGHPELVSTVMAISILGATFFQIPVGKLSDKFQRSTVLFQICLWGSVFSFVLYTLKPEQLSLIMVVLFILGGLVFTLYPLCINLVCDRVPLEKTVAATQGVLLSYGFGSVIGPIAAPYFTQGKDLSGLFLYIGSMMGVVVLFMTAKKFYIRRQLRRV